MSYSCPHAGIIQASVRIYRGGINGNQCVEMFQHAAERPFANVGRHPQFVQVTEFIGD